MSTYQSYQIKPHDRPAMVHAVKTMPRWKWRLLAFALVFGIVGAGGEAASYFLKKPAPSPSSSAAVSSGSSNDGKPAGSSGFMSGQPVAGSGDAGTPQAAPAASPTLTDMITPFMSHFGFSLFIGVIVGLIFRTFIRITLILTALVVGGAMALSHFHVNVDLAAVKSQTSQASSWFTTQAEAVKTMVFNALPSSTAASVGFLFGFKRR